ncbi:uncharacterized protein LOC144093814 [Amblyomma americanum]
MMLSRSARRLLVTWPMNVILTTPIVLLTLGLSGGEPRNRTDIPSVMMKLYKKNAAKNCDIRRIVMSIPANESIESGGATSFTFAMLRGEAAALAGHTRLALEFPRKCGRATVVDATASGWTGSRQLDFHREFSSYVAQIKGSPVLLQGGAFRVTLWTNKTHGFGCAPSQASASLILNYPNCREQTQRRFKRHHFYESGTDSPHPEPDQVLWRGDQATHSRGCRVVPLRVHFKHIGWDEWIVAPSSYMANKCAGECSSSVLRDIGGANHATVLSLLSGVRTNDVWHACCVPVGYTRQTVLYVDRHDNVVLRTFTNMRVSKCGCL